MKQTCENCRHWIDATSDCAEYLKSIANGWEISDEMNDALSNDRDAQNDCDCFEE